MSSTQSIRFGCESIQEKLQSCVCQHYEEKTKNKNKTAIGPKSVGDEANLDIEDMTKRKIPTLVMWYLSVINHLKHVFSNPMDAKLVRWRFDMLWMELSGKNLIFSIQNFHRRVEI
jgi:hypothetical protein